MDGYVRDAERELPAGALNKPHAVVGTGASTWQSMCYDQNGTMTSGGGRTITWNRSNLPATVDSGTVVETYGYDADGVRMTTTRGSITTIDLHGVWQEQLGTGLANNPFTLSSSANGQGIAVRNGSVGIAGSGTVSYLHSDHLGSASAVSNSSGAIVNTATYDPWGQVVEGGVPQTDKGYTGQQRDDTGLMWYASRLYDPNLGRFLSADSVVPGTASGSMDGVALKPLTVDFHEPGFVAGLNGESNQPFWFQMSGQQKQQAGRPWGPSNPQALNRYSYVLNNPMRYTDPSGHLTEGGDDRVGYQTVCQDSLGKRAHCTGANRGTPVTNAQGKELVETWTCDPYGTCRYEYYYEGDTHLDEFKVLAGQAKEAGQLAQDRTAVATAAGAAVAAVCLVGETPPTFGACVIAMAALGIATYLASKALEEYNRTIAWAQAQQNLYPSVVTPYRRSPASPPVTPYRRSPASPPREVH